MRAYVWQVIGLAASFAGGLAGCVEYTPGKLGDNGNGSVVDSGVERDSSPDDTDESGLDDSGGEGNPEDSAVPTDCPEAAVLLVMNRCYKPENTPDQIAAEVDAFRSVTESLGMELEVIYQTSEGPLSADDEGTILASDVTMVTTCGYGFEDAYDVVEPLMELRAGGGATIFYSDDITWFPNSTPTTQVREMLLLDSDATDYGSYGQEVVIDSAAWAATMSPAVTAPSDFIFAHDCDVGQVAASTATTLATSNLDHPVVFVDTAQHAGVAVIALHTANEGYIGDDAHHQSELILTNMLVTLTEMSEECLPEGE